jgi:hypothetical protein
MTDDLSRADVIRAVLAQRLAAHAPRDWGRTRRVVRIPGGDSPGLSPPGPSDKIYNVHCLPPYDGLPDALEKWAARKGLTKASSVVALVELGLANGIRERIPRTVSGQTRSAIIQQVPIDGDLGARLAAADARADKRHLKRTAAACEALLEHAHLATMATAHRARSDVHGDGLFVCMAGDFDQDVIDAATRYVPRVARAELVRALLAEQLERDGCLKRGWRDSASPAPLVKLPSMNDLDSIEI